MVLNDAGSRLDDFFSWAAALLASGRRHPSVGNGPKVVTLTGRRRRRSAAAAKLVACHRP